MPDVRADRRVAPRYSLIVVAEVSELSTGACVSARTSDVSVSGCYVDTLNPMKAGTKVRLVLTHSGESLEVFARVVYVSPGLGMGMCFDDPVRPEQLATLQGWLKSSTVLSL